MSGMGWKTATAPIPKTRSPSKRDSQVCPPFTDFHNPPVAAPTNTMFGSDSTASMAAIRPLIPAGPMLRAVIAERWSGFTSWAWTLALNPMRGPRKSSWIMAIRLQRVPRSGMVRLRCGLGLGIIGTSTSGFSNGISREDGVSGQVYAAAEPESTKPPFP